ncbi:MAG: SOS response-associated peptidase [Thermomicrobiales bacterium]
MCGRFAVIRQLDELARLFEAGLIRMEPFEPNYNVAPTTVVPAVITEDGKRELTGLTWGFTPRWAKSLKDGPRPINARRETVATNGMFRNAFSRRRAIIPADGFFEWKREASGKQPFYIHRADGNVMAFAGIWEHWTDPEGKLETPLDSCAIITTQSNDEMAEIHDRMPVILEPEDWDRWLDLISATPNRSKISSNLGRPGDRIPPGRLRCGQCPEQSSGSNRAPGARAALLDLPAATGNLRLRLRRREVSRLA